MKRIYVPTTSPLDWKPLLSRADRHWKAGYSAMSVAQAWEAAGDSFPPEIQSLLGTGAATHFENPRLLLAVPEYTVPLPGGERATQTDVFALARSKTGVVALAIEGKVDESFGPTVEGKRAEGAEDRLEYLHKLLGLKPANTGQLRYQLLHRTAAAILLAQEFGSAAAAMIVHSFSPDQRWFDDFVRFAEALGGKPVRGELVSAGERGGVPLFLGWAAGDQAFRRALPGSSY